MAIGLRKKRRIQIVIAGAVLLVLATGLIGYAMRSGIEFFRTPQQLASEPVADGRHFRLGGLVEPGSVVQENGEVHFVVTDGGEVTVPVVFAGILPDLFREGQGVIAAGAMHQGTFRATEVLARHDESYMPKEVAEALKEQGLLHFGSGVDPKPDS